MIVLDASVLIAYLDAEDDHHAAAEGLLTQAVDDDEDLAADQLTLAEVLVVPVRGGRLHRTQAALRDLELRELSFPDDAASRLAQLRVTTKLKMPDCCVLLAAEAAGASLASFDERVAQAAENRSLTVIRR